MGTSAKAYRSGDRMVRGGWSPASIAYVLAGKLEHCFLDPVKVTEHAESLTLHMSNGQEFELSVAEQRPTDSLGRPCRRYES